MHLFCFRNWLRYIAPRHISAKLNASLDRLLFLLVECLPLGRRIEMNSLKLIHESQIIVPIAIGF